MCWSASVGLRWRQKSWGKVVWLRLDVKTLAYTVHSTEERLTLKVCASRLGSLCRCVLRSCGTVTVPCGYGVHPAKIFHIHTLDADKMVSTCPSCNTDQGV